MGGGGAALIRVIEFDFILRDLSTPSHHSWRRPSFHHTTTRKGGRCARCPLAHRFSDALCPQVELRECPPLDHGLLYFGNGLLPHSHRVWLAVEEKGVADQARMRAMRSEWALSHHLLVASRSSSTSTSTRRSRPRGTRRTSVRAATCPSSRTRACASPTPPSFSSGWKTDSPNAESRSSQGRRRLARRSARL